MTYKTVHGDYTKQDFVEGAMTFDYHDWDSRKTRGCVCDATYTDVDCSKRMCGYGTDPLDTRDNLLLPLKYQTQQLTFQSSVSNCQNEGKTFALKFTSTLNEVYTTIPINFVCAKTELNDFVHDVQLALLTLPNQVINGITVAGSIDPSGYYVNLNVTFTGCYNEGPQHIIEVLDYECSNGCTPKLTGINMNHMFYRKHSNVSQIQVPDYASYECGRRGKCDYTSGECKCFEGYGGPLCGVQTLIV